MKKGAKSTTATATATSTATKAIRVAIYTRQSVESDLEFGSIDAQREAVEAYVQTKREEGWTALPTRYDDHGFSGGNTERPAFKQLMADVGAGMVDVIACYKLDRISRSTADFAIFLADLDRRGVHFCCVTQNFDSGTIAGKMLMSMLSVFGEFERATIAERTADKARAARRRGLWTGGRPILGYDIVNKRLVLNPTEAATVRQIVDLYLDFGGLVSTVEELARRGITNKSWTNQDGRQVLGRPFDKGTLRTLLTNPVHAGLLRCGNELVPGQHEAILTREKFDEVQRALRDNRLPFRVQPGPHGAILTGILRCGQCGAAMRHAADLRRGRLLRYYTCSTILTRGAAACRGSRGPAGPIEEVVVNQLRAIGTDPSVLLATITATHRQRTERLPELQAEVHRLQHGRTTILAQRTNLIQAIEGGLPATTVQKRLLDLDEQLEQIDTHLDEVTEELETIDAARLGEATIRSTLAKFGPVWDSLAPRERQRAIHLLVEKVTFHAQEGTIDLQFRDTSIKALAGHDATRRPA